ncbi:LacI family DNA-binding transcriptional regulator [Citrobacter sp. RHB25-C09]|uniref:LacI family DNA-binding transcriptional regulator n=1 Tax=Citrobacter sp. RHB25-C09 TaxID=2742624 RepID=UPI0015EE4DB9|nr:LacI family DNA-binding transcriptional regulator [Citrobacter sp. RHB25-C09]QMI03367.1 LacI family DNA-binding transcriptional regulator [Citrobacter sp. RHB25-C09]
MANIRDVAKHAGVSVSTVSNVLNGRTDQMRAETLERIQQSMQTLNYFPNRVAQQLKTGHAKMIGLLVPSIVNPSFAALAREVDLAAKKRLYRVLIGNTYRQVEEEEAFLDDMFSHGVRGIIVAACDIEKPHFVQAAKQGMMMVNYDGRMPANVESDGFTLDSVSMDNVDAGRMAAEHLIARGCRTLIFATVAGMTPSRAHKIEGFLSVVKQHGLYREGMIVEGQAMAAYGDTEMTELGRALAQKIGQQSPLPDGIVAINDAFGIGLMTGLHQAGINVPEQISIVGIDNISLSELVYPGLTSIMPPLKEMAEVMVERLIDRIENPALAPQEYLFPPSLVTRQSVREA